MKNNKYKRFPIMLAISFVIMYAVMFLNIVELNHIYLSATRFYMALLMVSPMALLMLLMMRDMYTNKKINRIIFVISTLIFIFSLIFLRAQIPIGDEQYMKAMIPHHSSAILTSENADIKDPEVKQLAKEIIETQEREIAQMKDILARMNK
ncbi:DUF305 domain-containing protein [Candidatus Woesearchaeota archaeon]|nr:DUF305 domain-containing protein [Candidatus Woesearchaeota archaeon]